MGSRLRPGGRSEQSQEEGLKHAGQEADEEIGKTPDSSQAVAHKLYGIQRSPTKHKPVNQVKSRD